MSKAPMHKTTKADTAGATATPEEARDLAALLLGSYPQRGGIRDADAYTGQLIVAFARYPFTVGQRAVDVFLIAGQIAGDAGTFLLLNTDKSGCNT